MYGYIRPHAPELRVREEAYYRAVYCGLCRTMGRCTGQCSRLTLSYDFTFFALARMALTGEGATLRPRRCLVHPTRKRPIAEPSEALRLSACLSGLLAYHKVADNLADERGLRRLKATLAQPFAASLRRRALRRGRELLAGSAAGASAPAGTTADTAGKRRCDNAFAISALDAAVADGLRRLSQLEAECPPSVDEPADCFGAIMSALLAAGLEGDRQRLATAIGRHVGRWIYILDAADDYADDVRNGRYNPFACLYTPPGEAPAPALSPERLEEIRTALLGELLGLEQAIDLLPPTSDPELAALISNILYLGMPRRAEAVLFGSPDPGTPEAAPPPEITERS